MRRLRETPSTLSLRLAKRPALHSLQPPAAAIVLSRTLLAARKLEISLARLHVNRSLSKRPKLETLVVTNVIPQDCCRRDRVSGEYIIPRSSHGLVVEKKKKLEQEAVKQRLRLRMEKKLWEIKRRKRDYAGVGTLIWRLTKRIKGNEVQSTRQRVRAVSTSELQRGRVLDMRAYWEGLTT